MFDDWATIYKVLLIVTILFHPHIKIREYSFFYLLSQWVMGLVNLHFFSSSPLYYLYSSYGELLAILLILWYFCKPSAIKETFSFYWRSLGLLCVPFILFTLDIHQYHTIYKSYWLHHFRFSVDWVVTFNIVGFDLMLAFLWAKDAIIRSVSERINIPNIIMFWILLSISYFSGPY